MAVTHVDNEYQETLVEWLKPTYMGERWAGDVAGYWMHRIPDGEEFKRLQHQLAKMAYDEARHADMIIRMIRRFGGNRAVNETYEMAKGNDSWLKKMNEGFTRGPENYIEFLTTHVLGQDVVGIYMLADIAEHSPDPVWADTAEALAEDERLHGSIGPEFIPVVIEHHGKEILPTLEKGIHKWVPIMFGLQGQKDSPFRQKMIDAGITTLTCRDTHEISYDQICDVFEPYDIEIPPMSELEQYSHYEAVEQALEYAQESKNE